MTPGYGVSERIVRPESGMALTELLVVIAVLTVVLGAMLGLLQTTARLAPQDQERAHSIRDSQGQLFRMTRELRQAYQVHTVTGSSMDVRVTIGGVNKRVEYRCDQPHPNDPGNPYDDAYGRCLRWESTNLSVSPYVPGVGTLVVDRVLNGTTVFSPTASSAPYPKYVKVVVHIPSRGERRDARNHSVVLDDGFYLRNCPLDGPTKCA